MSEDGLEPGEVRPDAMEFYRLIEELRPENRDLIVWIALLYVERILAEESSDHPTLH